VVSVMVKRGGEAAGAKLALIRDAATGWYQSWYFELRLEEEVYRAARYALPLTVAVVRLGDNWFPSRPACKQVLDAAASKLRRNDLPAIIGPHELGFCLTHVTREQGELIMGRLLLLFNEFDPKLGLSSFLGMDQSAVGLLNEARLAAIGSRPE